MPASAPRIDLRLLAALERLDHPRIRISDTHRQLGEVADHLGLTRPSYEQVRVLVHLQRSRRGRGPSMGQVLLEISFRLRPPGDAMLKALDLLPDPPRP